MRDLSYTVTRDITPDECHWLKSTVEAGTIVYRYFGYTYGCIGSGMAVTREEGKTPFFELPRDALVLIDTVKAEEVTR